MGVALKITALPLLFVLWLVPAVERIPRSQKFLLGDRIQGAALDVLERLIEATYTKQRDRHLAGANLGLEKLRFMCRLERDLRCLDHRRYWQKRMLRVGLAARFALTLVLTASLVASIRPALAAGDEAEAPCAKDANEVCTQDAWTEEDYFTRELWGFFTSPKVRSRVVINNHPENDYPYLQFSNGPKHELFGSSVMASICRHQEAALDYIYIEPLVLGSGAVPIVKIYRIHPTTNAIELVYTTDLLDDFALRKDTLIDAEGNCRWRELQNLKHALSTALAPLVGSERQPVDFQIEVGETTGLLPRHLENETVRNAFLAIHENGIVNTPNVSYKGRVAVPRPLAVDVAGARYASANDSESWLVVRIIREACDVPGIVLVQNRRQGTWRSIYELSPDQLAIRFRTGILGTVLDPYEPDCATVVGLGGRLSIALMREFYVKDDKLFAEVCLADCVGSFRDWPLWAWFEIDLLNNTATRLQERPDFMPLVEDIDDQAAEPNLAEIAG